MSNEPGPGRDEGSVDQFVESMAALLADRGFPLMAARVLMVLMTADQPRLTAANLADRLPASAAAVSGAVRFLVQIGMLEREPVRGSRRSLYRITHGGWYAMSFTKGDFYRQVADLADNGVHALGGDGTAAGARVAEMRDFYRFVHSELDGLLERWRESRRAPSPTM